MSASFVALALSYCMGRATLSLRGAKKRPWLEIRRRETDLTYLNHQLKMLHRAHDGKLEAVSDVVQTDWFYDDRRIRVHSPDLYRVYELLFFRDERRITPEILKIVGKQGLAAMWCDYGSRSKSKMGLRTWGTPDETRMIRHWISEMGYQPVGGDDLLKRRRIEIADRYADELASDLRNLIPRCKLPTLRR